MGYATSKCNILDYKRANEWFPVPGGVASRVPVIQLIWPVVQSTGLQHGISSPSPCENREVRGRPRGLTTQP